MMVIMTCQLIELFKGKLTDALKKTFGWREEAPEVESNSIWTRENNEGKKTIFRRYHIESYILLAIQWRFRVPTSYKSY